MYDSHGQEISLPYVTVKVPGQNPRGSRGTQQQQQQQTPAAAAAAAVTSTPGVAPGANGVLNEPITTGRKKPVPYSKIEFSRPSPPLT